MQLDMNITWNVKNRICFVFNNFFFKNKRERNDIATFNNIFRSSAYEHNYAAELEFYRQSPSNANTNYNCVRFKQYNVTFCE